MRQHQDSNLVYLHSEVRYSRINYSSHLRSKWPTGHRSSDGRWTLPISCRCHYMDQHQGQQTDRTRYSISSRIVSPSETMAYWHNKLGHRSYITIIRMYRQVLLLGVEFLSAPTDSDIKSMPLCKHCQCAKHDRHILKYNRSPHHVPLQLNKGQMISTALKGLFRIKGGPKQERYYQGFICMHSHNLWCYFLQTKHTVYENTQHIYTQIGGTLTHHHIDGGSELISAKIYEFLLSHGVDISYTAPYCKEGNVIIERSHRTIFESAHAMLLYFHLNFNLWCNDVT